jgi:hypothetical protein
MLHDLPFQVQSELDNLALRTLADNLTIFITTPLGSVSIVCGWGGVNALASVGMCVVIEATSDCKRRKIME